MKDRAVTHVYRWDLDKTYLDTDFESLRGLARAATESPAAKTNVPGSASLLRALALEKTGQTSWVAIVSGSPRQMRPVLEEKLRLDGVRWNELHLKDTLGQLRRGRLRAVRAQLGYKLPRLLSSRASLATTSREVLFGDDAESDALIYALYAAIVEGSVSIEQLAQLLKIGGVYEDTAQRTLSLASTVQKAPAVELIFIYLARPSPPERFHPLGSRLIPIHSYLQAALVLGQQGQLEPQQVVEVVQATLDPAERAGGRRLANECQDLIRRGHLPASYLDSLVGHLRASKTSDSDLALFSACKNIAERLDEVDRFVAPAAPKEPDWEGIVRTWTR